MASRSPKLPPEITPPPASPARRLHVHVVPTADGWGIRVGRRIEKTFATQEEASRAAIPFARERGSRLFVHYPSGVVRESSTEPVDEMFLEMRQMAYDDYNKPQPEARNQPKAVHVVRDGDGWGMRVGRRIEKRFSERSDAVVAAMPFARTRGARLFVHYDNGEIRESATGEGEEMLFKAWKQIRAPGGWQGE